MNNKESNNLAGLGLVALWIVALSMYLGDLTQLRPVLWFKSLFRRD